jgi:lipoprotein-anchoring transpeptidase ErfK/SrfK
MQAAVGRITYRLALVLVTLLPVALGAQTLPSRKYPDRHVVVNLSENRVYVFDGQREIWSAVAGTGTGLNLTTASDQSWDFSTPRGVMEVKRMEKDPIWVASDWYFIEKGLKVPPQNDPSRNIPGVMGTTAIYLGDGIAIHGTNNPALLRDPDPKKRNVSHGCIRLTNEHARQLMEMIEVGTPVIIH